MDTVNLSPTAVMEAGLSRLLALTEKYGITSPEVLSAVERWGSILDDLEDSK